MVRYFNVQVLQNRVRHQRISSVVNVNSINGQKQLALTGLALVGLHHLGEHGIQVDEADPHPLRQFPFRSNVALKSLIFGTA